MAVEDFIAHGSSVGTRAGPAWWRDVAASTSAHAGCAHFHDERLPRRRHGLGLSAEELAAWVAAERPRTAANQFSMASLTGLVRYELLYALQRRDEMPPPLDPVQVGILISRLEGASSIRRADPEAICETAASIQLGHPRAVPGPSPPPRAGMDRPSRRRPLCRRPLGGAACWTCSSNGSRRWQARQGVVNFADIELRWLREVTKDWARTTRPYLQILREALRACRAPSEVLVAAGRTDPALLGAGDFALSRAGHLRPAPGRRELVLGRSPEPAPLQAPRGDRTRPLNGLMTEVPDPSAEAGHSRGRGCQRGGDREGSPGVGHRQLDANIGLLGPTGRWRLDLGGRPAGHAAGDLPVAPRHRPAPGRDRELEGRLHRGDRRPAQPRLRQPQGGRMRRRLPITAETAEDVLAWAAAPGRNGRTTAHARVAVPNPAFEGPPVARPPHRQLRRPGVQDLGGQDRQHRQRGARP